MLPPMPTIPLRSQLTHQLWLYTTLDRAGAELDATRALRLTERWLADHADPAMARALTAFGPPLLERGLVEVVVRDNGPQYDPEDMLAPGDDAAALRERLLAQRHLLLLRCGDLLQSALLGLWLTIALARTLRELHGGEIVDPLLGAPLPPDLERPLPAPGRVPLAPFLRCPWSPSQRGAEQVRITTTGMRRFGLPNLDLDGAPMARLDEAPRVLLAAGQSLLFSAQGLPTPPLPEALELAPELELTSALAAYAVGAQPAQVGACQLALDWSGEPVPHLGRREPLLALRGDAGAAIEALR